MKQHVSIRTAFLALALLLGAAQAAQAQRHKTQLRTVHGSVLDRNDNPLPSSVVYLKNTRTATIRTYIAEKDAHYRFAGLDPNVDYDIHAEYDHMSSAHHTISSFDDRRDIVLNLKIEKKK